ncbi:MAG: presenilin family intramembrane aspartyl protease [Candidatus ainarchaeum sp.]|nr:presenilin family intramembrane aspartyl protease [Candidatus ainarchaeum sp.]MDD5096652.1 presenilin family intramembrane aspartyl protease [Candidatus ainarchaeum sp.]
MNPLLKVLLFFIATQLLGIYTGIFILSDAMSNPIVGEFMSFGEGVGSLPVFILYILFGAAIFLVLIRLNIAFLFALLEFAVISVTSSILFYAFLRPFIPDALTAMAVSALAGMALAVLKHFIHHLKNVAAIFSSAGAGAVFGFSFSFFASLVIFFIMAIYDYIAVFRTRHMVSMAREIIKQDMSFTVTATEKTASGKVSRLDLGTGDLALPVMVEVAAYPIHPLLSLVTLVGATAGVSFVLIYAWKNKVFLPAIPFIFSGMMVSLIAAFALTIIKLL